MFKGTTTIELKDVKTGVVETLTQENMVTNALQEVMRPLGHTLDASLMYGQLSDTSNLLGGLLCFDATLDENPNNIYAPNTANVVACGVYNMQNSTTGTQRGGFNYTESILTPTDGLVKYVYDFSTAQGNGTIHSVCLTSSKGGYCGYGGDDATRCFTSGSCIKCGNEVMNYERSAVTGGTTSGKHASSLTAGTTEYFFALDYERDVALYFRVNTGLQTVSIIERRAWLKSVSVFYNPLTQKPVVAEYEIPLNFTFTTTAYFTYNYDLEDSTLSIFTCTAQQIANGGTFNFVQINIDTKSAVCYIATNNTGETIVCTRCLACHRGYLFMRGNNSPYNFYKSEIGNWTNVEQFTVGTTELHSTSAIDFVHGGRVYLGSTSQSAIANLADMKVTQTEHYAPNCGGGTLGSFWKYPIIGSQTHWVEYYTYGSAAYSYYAIKANYLATINNLSTPVTKTDDKTMKISYSIQSAT